MVNEKLFFLTNCRQSIEEAYYKNDALRGFWIEGWRGGGSGPTAWKVFKCGVFSGPYLHTFSAVPLIECGQLIEDIR